MMSCEVGPEGLFINKNIFLGKWGWIEYNKSIKEII